MTTQTRDRRLTPARPDRAAGFLRGSVDADIFVPGERRTVVAPLAPLRREPRLECGLDTEALRGEAVMVYEETIEGWAWVQLVRDGYVGYLPSGALGPAEAATHQVAVPRTFVYPDPNLKAPVTVALSLGARLAVGRFVDGYAVCSDGFLLAGHLTGLEIHEPDFVAVAERFLDVPYLWGGKSSLGLDCSGLVQISLAAAGIEVPRDTDLQEGCVGTPLPTAENLRRGDLVFWKGHVGMMRDPKTLLHANAQTMMVSSEPLAGARVRIRERTGADITSVRRI